MIDVQHIARLARIALTPEEEIKFEKELSGILAFIEELRQANTEGIEPMAGGTTIENIMREDRRVSGELEQKAETLLEVAPEKKDGYVKVKAVFE